MAKKRTSSRAGRTDYVADHLYSVVFTASRLEDLSSLLTVTGVDVGCRHAGVRRDDSGVHLAALVSGRVLPLLASDHRWKMRVIDDQTVRGAESLKLVGRGNRFRRADALPEGVGRLVDTPEESDRGPLSE